MKNRKHTKETKEKMSIAKQNISEETRKKMSNSQKGKKVSEETRKKLSIYHKKNPIKYWKDKVGPHNGHKHSKESREKIKKSLKNKIYINTCKKCNKQFESKSNRKFNCKECDYKEYLLKKILLVLIIINLPKDYLEEKRII